MARSSVKGDSQSLLQRIAQRIKREKHIKHLAPCLTHYYVGFLLIIHIFLPQGVVIGTIVLVTVIEVETCGSVFALLGPQINIRMFALCGSLMVGAGERE